MDEEYEDDGWGRHKVEDEVSVFCVYSKTSDFSCASFVGRDFPFETAIIRFSGQ